MSRILDSADWTPSTTISIPASAVRKCLKMNILRGLTTQRGVIGVLLTFSGGRLYRRTLRNIPSPIGDNQIVLMKDLIVINFTGGYNSLDVFIGNLPSGGVYFILERSGSECGEDDGPGGDGYKIKLP
jgi:hypothetical protein